MAKRQTKKPAKANKVSKTNPKPKAGMSLQDIVMARQVEASKALGQYTTKPKPTAPKAEPKPKISMLVYGDSPGITSGFATVVRNVFYQLMQTGRYHIDIYGISDRGDWKDPEIHPYRVYQSSPPGTRDPYGRSRFIDVVRGGSSDLQPPWDIIFFLNDPFVLENPIPKFNMGTLPAIRDIQKTSYLKLPSDQWFKTVGYWPVDTPVKPHWVLNAISLTDYPVAYTHYGKKEIERGNMLLDERISMPNLQVIHHGNNNKEFVPIKRKKLADFRRKYFGGAVRDETFLVISIARNQRRKDLTRTMQIFKEFKKRRPDSYLYIHAEETEAWGSLREAATQLGLEMGYDWGVPSNLSAAKGFPTKILNYIYNCADAFISTTQGEGWGLPITEAMATKVPVLVPNITAIPEIIGTDKISNIDNMEDLIKKTIRGIPLKAGSTSSEWVCHGALDLERFRPLTNVDDGVNKLLWVYDNPDKVKPIVNRAYNWIKRMDWEDIAKKWDKLFTKIAKELEDERNNPKKAQKRAKKIQTKQFPQYYKNQMVESLTDLEQ